MSNTPHGDNIAEQLNALNEIVIAALAFVEAEGRLIDVQQDNTTLYSFIGVLEEARRLYAAALSRLKVAVAAYQAVKP